MTEPNGVDGLMSVTMGSGRVPADQRRDGRVAPSAFGMTADTELSPRPVGDGEAGRTIKILIVDPHIVVRHGLSSWLTAIPDLDVVGLAADGREAIDMCDALRPDVVLIDIAMPVQNGVEAIAQIHEMWPEIAVIAFTATA